MKFKVLKKDIKKGIVIRDNDDDPRIQCPIDLCLERKFPDKHILTGMRYVSIGNKEYALPFIARDFILAFDDGDEVSPFEFELDIK